MSAVKHQLPSNSTVTCIAKIFMHNSLPVCTKSLQYMTIVMVLTIMICHDSRIVMSQNVTIAHLHCIAIVASICIKSVRIGTSDDS